MQYLRLYQRNSSPSVYHLFPSPKKNLCDHKIKHDRQVEANEKRRQIIKDTNFYQQSKGKMVPQYYICRICAGNYV